MTANMATATIVKTEPRRKLSDPLHEGLFTWVPGPVRRCRSSSDRLLARSGSCQMVSRRRPSSSSSASADSAKTAAVLLASPLSFKLTDAPLFTAVKATSNKVQASLSPFQVQLESPLPTATTLVSAGSAPDPQTLPSSSKKRERERIHLSELDIAAYPGYVTYFRQDGAPIGTYRLDTRWDNSSDFANHGTNDHSASCSLHGSNSSSDQEEEIERETTPVSRALCKILFCGVDEAIPPYVSPPRVRPSSKQLRNYVQQDRLVGRTRKRQYVGASGIKSVNRQNRVVKTTAASRRLARLPNPSKSVFQIFEDDDSTPAPATDSLLMEACSYPSATPADRYANKENSGFLGF